jgi:RNA polymerase sigma-70 factor, ECF subfamily
MSMQGHDLIVSPVLGAVARPRTEFDEAYPGLYRASYRIAFRLLGEKEEAEDIAQEACIRACQRWNRLTDGDYAAAWVAHVTTNLSLDRFRRRRTARRYLQGASVQHAKFDADRVDLHRALDTLPRRQREVVLLRYVADLPELEVARQLRCSAGSVKTHASRGLAALRSALGEAVEV